MSDDLKNFKISDVVKQPVDGPRPQKREEAPASTSAGFPRIEALVEQDDPDLVGFAERYAALEELAKNGASNKVKAQAKKAALAYERTSALLQHLLATKKRLQETPSKG